MKHKALPLALALALAALLAACSYESYDTGPYPTAYGAPSAAPVGGGPSGNPYGYENDNDNFAPYHGHGERVEPVPGG